MQLSSFFQLVNFLLQKLHQSLVFISSIRFYTYFSMLMFGYMSHTEAYFLWGSGSCDFLNFIWIICILSCCCSSTFTLSSILTSIAFSELSYILRTPNFQGFFSACYFFCSISFFRIKSAVATKLYFFVIFHLIFCAGSMTGIITYLNVNCYLISISEYFATLIAQCPLSR